MPFYKDTQNNLHFLENESFENFLPVDHVKITDDEAAKIQSEYMPPPAPESTTQK